MAIIDWPETLRPRERLIRLGPQSLSDAELLAVFLRIGIAGKSAVDLGRELVEHFGSLSRMFAADLSAFTSLPGLGPAKFAQLQAVLELARRSLHEQMHSATLFKSPQTVQDYLRLLIGDKPHECFVILFLDVQCRLIDSEQMFRGTLDHASVYPREVVKSALQRNAASIILAHNHPSGQLQPSQSDLAITTRLQQALELCDIRLLDHFIITRTGTYSFAEHGQLPAPSAAPG